MFELPDIETLILIGLFILSALPLYKAVNFVKDTGRKGKVSFLEVLIVVLISGIVISLIFFYFTIYGGLISLIALLWIYKNFFRLSWPGSFAVWVIYIVFVIISAIIIEVISQAVFSVSVFLNN